MQIQCLKHIVKHREVENISLVHEINLNKVIKIYLKQIHYSVYYGQNCVLPNPYAEIPLCLEMGSLKRELKLNEFREGVMIRKGQLPWRCNRGKDHGKTQQGGRQ